MMKQVLALLAVVAVIAFAPSAWAQPGGDAQGSLYVDATVMPECIVTDSGILHFGNYYSIGSESSLTGEGSLVVRCTEGSSVHVGLGQGQNYELGRHMRNGGFDQLAYELYLDSSHEQIWGDTDNFDRKWIPSASGWEGNLLSVYGVIPSHQAKPVGQYTDTVVINVWIDPS